MNLKSQPKLSKKLYSTKWSELVSHMVLNTFNEGHFNKPSILPFTEDMQRLHQRLEKTARLASENPEKTISTDLRGTLQSYFGENNSHQPKTWWRRSKNATKRIPQERYCSPAQGCCAGPQKSSHKNLAKISAMWN